MTVHTIEPRPTNQATQQAPTSAAKGKEAAHPRHAVVPDFVRFKMHRLGERLDHMQPFGAAYAQILQKLKIAPTPAPQPPRPALGRARSSSLPESRPMQEAPAPRHAQETPRPAYLTQAPAQQPQQCQKPKA